MEESASGVEGSVEGQAGGEVDSHDAVNVIDISRPVSQEGQVGRVSGMSTGAVGRVERM